MSYDGFYSGLSSRGTANSILNKAEQLDKEIKEVQTNLNAIEEVVGFNAQVAGAAAQVSTLASQDSKRYSEEALAAKEQAQLMVLASGFELPAIPYVDGTPLVIGRPTQLIVRGGQLYSVRADKVFPYTLTGTWATDLPNLVPREDQMLRQELSDITRGAAMVAWKRGTDFPPSFPTVEAALDSSMVNFLERLDLVVDRPDPNNQLTWDFAPLVEWAAAYSNANRKTIYIPDYHYRLGRTVNLAEGARFAFEGKNSTFTSDVVTATVGATCRFICDIPSGPVFKVANGGQGRLHLKGIAFANVNTTNPECYLCEGGQFGSQWDGIYLHSLHGANKGDMGFIVRVMNSVMMNMKKTVFDGAFVDSYMVNNHISGSVNTIGAETTIISGSQGLSLIQGNFFEFFTNGIRTAQFESSKVVYNIFDYIARPFVGSGITAGMLSLNSFTHCCKDFAYRLGLAADDPLRTTDWINVKIGNTAKGLTMIGNMGNQVDKMFEFRSGAYNAVFTSGNVIAPAGLGAKVLFDVSTADIDKLRLVELDDFKYAAAPSLTGVSELQRYRVGDLYFQKRAGGATLITCLRRKVLANFTAVETIDLSGMATHSPLKLFVTVGAGFGGYSYVEYSIIRDSNTSLRITKVYSNESSAAVASSAITATGTTLNIDVSGSAATKTLAYNFLSS